MYTFHWIVQKKYNCFFNHTICSLKGNFAGVKMEERITLDYGSGGKKTAALIDELIVPRFRNEALAALGDGAILEGCGRLVFSTDSFVVSPYIFPGGNIGKLAVCGTVNDISVSGGTPRYISLSMIIEEGFPIKDLELILDSVRDEAEKAGVSVVTGDTKVVEHGKCDGIYLNTAGIGFLTLPGLSEKRMVPGDKVLVSGTMGDHGTAVMLARNENLVHSDIASDCAALSGMTEKMFSLGTGLRVMRDPTRGGLATTLCEFIEKTGLYFELEEEHIPVGKETAAACKILGLDPLYSANEGKLIAVVAPQKADEALEIMKSFEMGKDAAIIGTVKDAGNNEARRGKVLLSTAFGGSRIMTKLSGAQLPRIC